MFERFTHSARQVVVLAQTEAQSLRHNYIGTEHLLLGLLGETEGLAARVLNELGVDRDDIHKGVVDYVGAGPVNQPDAAALDAIGIDLDAVRRRVEEAFGPNALERTRAARACAEKRRGFLGRGHRRPFGEGHIPFTPRAKKTLELSLREALALGHGYIGTEHILLGLLREGQGLAAHLLSRADVNFEVVRRRIVEELSPDSDAG
ncbi:MAG: Clp protease [Actinobacteria bacterium]|nr:Clp protease [Actinomycetota bacterium]